MAEKNKEQSKNIEKFSLNQLKKDLTESQKQASENLAGWQRERADFLNYKKEEFERAQAIKQSFKQDLVLVILGVYENLEKAKEHLPEGLADDEWAKGVLQVASQFRQVLNELGIEEVETDGAFDPEIHEAVEQVEVEDKESGAIMETISKGYILDGQLLRPAKVKVIK